MKYELRIFFTALMFYTRIPCPKWVDHKTEYLNKATRYLPFVGWIVGAIAAAFFLLGAYLVNINFGVVLSMLASILTTGAFHEDGFADVCDGFGGGWTKEKIMLIMKDSRMGAYGLVGMILMLLGKFALLVFLLDQVFLWPMVFLLLITAHASSRFVASSFIFTHSYARESDDSKAKPVAEKVELPNLFIGLGFAVIPLLAISWFSRNFWLMLSIVPMYLLKMYLGNYFKKWVGGYTGDCLGATQQLCEIVFYISIAVIWKFT